MESNRVVKEREVKSYKWSDLKDSPPKNAILYILDKVTGEVEVYVTDKFGLPKPLKSTIINIKDYVKVDSNNNIIVEDGKLFSKKYISGDDYIVVSENPVNYRISLNDNKLELKENKQNSLQEDGTGTKYPTVDAVNKGLTDVISEIEQIIIDRLQPQYHHFSNETEVTVIHNLNKIPSVTITVGEEEGYGDISFSPDNNSLIVRFSSPLTGIIVIQ